MPYRVTAAGRVDEAELIYRYEEDVFDPAEPAARNLAGMIGAQLALNYGLFCRELAFHGEFDEADRRFLQEFAENTAREIYVNKFLRLNPFLIGPVSKLEPEVRDHYCRARIQVEGSNALEPGLPAEPWNRDVSRCAVLSSGGKDSLLSFGLLDEIGAEVHPVFLNESGRHWYTALNAHRHFSSTFARTSRVWTNSDRLFAWMLRRLPFIRSDFSGIRSDEYPVRLWTVAVFLFGALPLLRKRGIGRIVIGDEYDTTVRTRHAGIPHYAGLYDQGRYFDNAMVRHFRRKGWRLHQFSILRPLSELLIQKVLVERYPDLQRHQVSCHATHLEGNGRVRPCGACEKCRRIVGMLVALGGDPRACGYTTDQIDRCLVALPIEGVHQERAAAQHLAYLLSQSLATAAGGSRAFPARPNPEVLSLRFDREHSPRDAIPRDLRAPLYRILLGHSDGAVERRGRVWTRVDPLESEFLSIPYPFERPERSANGGGTGYLLAEMNWPQARARFGQVDVALLPVGAIEQHGPHLPLDTDAYDADLLARRVAEACSEPRPIVLPLVSYGVSYHHDDFSGTFSVNPDTMARLVHEIGLSAAHNGVTKLIIVNGHGGNGPALHLAAQMINKDTGIFTCIDSGETSDADVAKLTETPNDVHAGEIETSTTLAVRPDLVDMANAPRSVPRFSSRYLDFSSKRAVGWYARTKRMSRTGVMGDASQASREKGERIWEFMVRRLVELVEEIKGLPLDEIYQRRY
jgi:creatinine amidohydrolase/Fe(II)-dependent formamide hydrolase-like protein